MGFSLIGIPFISFFIFTKGVQIGLSSSLLILTYEWKGILGIILTIIPQILFDLIAYYMIAIVAYDWIAWVLLVISLISCYLLNAEIPFFSFKAFKKNKLIVISFIIGCLILIAFCVIKALITKHTYFAFFSGSACIIWYVALNLILNISTAKNK